MNRTSFTALVIHDLRLYLSSRRFAIILFAEALVHSLWLLFLSLVSPLALADASAVLSPFPLILLIAIPSFSLMTWRDEMRSGCLGLVFSALLSSRALALARLAALFVSALILCTVPLCTVGVLSLLLPYPPLAFIPLCVALLWVAVAISLASSFFALLMPKGPFAAFAPLSLTILAALAVWIWPALDALFPFRHWQAFLDGVVAFDSLSLLLVTAVLVVCFEGRMVESFRRGGGL